MSATSVTTLDAVEALLDRSHRLGADLRVTNFAGGNTSCKVRATDPVSGEERVQLFVKGSGGDLGTLRRAGLAVLDVERVRALERGYRGVEHEDDQAGLLSACEAGPGAAPSIDTPLHALVPFTHVDHVHPDAVIALATCEGGEEIVAALYGGTVGWLDWQRPGFDLALRLRDLVAARPQLRGVVLGGHGLITWGDTSEECYRITLDAVERAARHIDAAAALREGPAFGGRRVEDLAPERRRAQAARLLPVLRGLCSGRRPVVAHFRDDPVVLEFAGSVDAARLARQGTSCPDHFLRTKRTPLLLDLAPGDDPVACRDRLAAAVAAYCDQYSAYYDANAQPDSPLMRDPQPVVVLWPGVGMVSMGATAAAARIAGEFYVNAINVMRGAEALSRYAGMSEAEAFRVEYWALEEAKLRRLPAEKPLSRRVALVTGAAGGIGAAIACRFAAEGACVVLADLDPADATALAAEIGEQATSLPLDVTDEASVERAFDEACLRYGGVDLVVNNAGISVSQPLVEHSLADYERLHAVIDRGSFLVSRAFARRAIAQGLGGDIVYVVSKNAVAVQPDNVGYSSAKAAQLHQMRLLAAELAQHGIRVNAINPDAVVRGSKIFSGGWGEERAARYGVDPDKLGEYYARRSLLGREILPEDIAAAAMVLVGGDLARTTGAVIPVDGGVPAAFLR
ncbi:MAG TPA: bifunctional rhamnulose-1-phosphate aldolase/short-chain dehydrogenase [Candidatus Angelobacter sp.]|jgi:rhamnulose-1-phosphate aldolase/alcohol dehydrogenase|nr:bifunctional rhamnulose-1-phosphate aldolase/short-chain dehydrogenase [Candidatus Angelobacter sp.]